MKKIVACFLTMAVITVNAQNKAKTEKVNNPKTMKTASGLEYTIKEKGNGKKPMIGDKVVVHYTGRLTNDSVFDSSVRRGNPFTFELGKGQVIKGWDEAFQLLQVGDKATIKFGPELGYGERATGPIPANSILIFDVELLDVIEGLRQWTPPTKDTVTLASGAKYLMVKSNPKGEKVETNAKVTLHYSGFFMDGKMFDSSVERKQPFSLKIGTGQLLPALEEGLKMLHKGEKAKFILPYNVAYGEQGRPPIIPPMADLIFDIEVLDVIPNFTLTRFDNKGKELKTTPSGLKYYVIAKGASPVKAEAGKTVQVHYSGYLADGKLFDSSVERGNPIEFKLGQGQVIQGWDEGISLMNVGDKLTLIIPYHLAYGETGHPPLIPPKAELTFDVELVDVKN